MASMKSNTGAIQVKNKSKWVFCSETLRNNLRSVYTPTSVYSFSIRGRALLSNPFISHYSRCDFRTTNYSYSYLIPWYRLQNRKLCPLDVEGEVIDPGIAQSHQNWVQWKALDPDCSSVVDPFRVWHVAANVSWHDFTCKEHPGLQLRTHGWHA